MALNDRTKIVDVSIESEMKTSYIDYSMSVIVSRALPDVRDGLKPSQRRILVAMNDLNLTPGRGYRKCAKIAGDTSGNYHPHGEQVVYPTLVRMAQDWVMRYPLVDGQGNYGCFTGETRIRLLDGTERSFAELAALGPDAQFSVYSVDRAGRIVVGRGRDARVTRHAAPLVEVVLDDGSAIRCTPDHRFLLRSNTYKRAEDLTPDDSLMPGYFDTAPVKAGLNDYLRVHQPILERWDFVHHLADEFNARHGLAAHVRGPFVRHHRNFDRWDNRPENIERMGFLEHLHLHARQLAELWRDPVFRAGQRRAVQHYDEQHPEARKNLRRRFIERNQDPTFRTENGRRVSSALRERLEDRPEERLRISRRMRALWADEGYRARYGEDHFSRMANTLWSDPRTRSAHREKIARQWGDPAFRRAQSAGVRRSNLRRMSRQPDMMQTLAGRASEALSRNWRDPEYRRRVMRRRIARQAARLLALAPGGVTPELYESRRDAGWIPRLSTALRYCDGFDEIVRAGRTYNHRVVSVRPLAETADVYDITVDEHHNFLLAAGVFVHNSIDGDAPAAMRYCVAGETRVATAAGTQRIDALVPGVQAESDHDISLELFDRHGRIVTASKLFHSGSHPTKRLRTAEGYELIGTGNHPILCLDRVNGVPGLTWKLLDKVAPGDRVVLLRQVRPPEEALPERERQTAILLGAFLSEGWISSSRAGFNNIDRQYFDRVLAAYDAIVGGARYVYSRTIASGSLLFELDIQNLQALRESPLAAVQGRSRDKVIPESVWMANAAFKRTFLRSLFTGDGSSSLLPRHTIQITYSTRSEQLSREVQLLLLEFGVVSRICSYPDGEFKVVITNRRDARQFARNVGFLGWKHEKLESALASIPVVSRALRHDHVPFLADYNRSQSKPWKGHDWLSKHNVDRIERWEHAGTAILDGIESDVVRGIASRRATTDYYYAEVESVVDAGVQPVYSVRVDTDEHAFITNGFISHNTEARLTALAAEMLADLEKNTVDFRPNYDETREEPIVLPGVVPNLLINGCSGIAVGMATEVPPHNLSEVCEAIAHVIDHPEATAADLMKIVRGPDFPTGGIIYGTQGIRDCYANGRGLIKLRARVQVEEGRQGRMSLVATEIPFQVNKAALLEKIADLVKEAKVSGISDLRDESDRDGMRIVVELKKDANPKVVLNQLFVHSPLQTTFGAIMLALVDQRPQVLTLRGLLDQYVLHRQIVVRRRTEFDLAEAEKRAHILEGLKIALDHLDAVIALIRKSPDVEAARAGLMREFALTEIQANAILEMRLSRLTGLERKKVEEEYLEVIKLIERLKSILASPKKILAIIKDEIARLKEKHGDARRTEIAVGEGDIQYEDTIEQKDMVITISHAGYIKRQEISSYRSQRRGGKGVIGARTKEEDYIEHLFVAGTHSYLLFLTDRGRCYWLKVHEIEQAGRMARGRPLVNHLEGLSRDERVQAVVAVKAFDDQHYLVCATRKGLIKKTVLSAYGNPRRGGINAILLEEGDALIEAIISDGTQDFILAKKKGLAVRFHENEVRAMGRTSYGVKAVALDDDTDEVVSMVGVQRQATLLTVTENGYGKRSEIAEYRVSHRGAKGIITIKTTDRNGSVVAVKEVVDGDELMLITRSGQMIRMPVKGISVIGRNTQGVRLVNLAPAGEGDLLPDAVAAVTRVVGEEDTGVVNGSGGEGEPADAGPAPAPEG